MRSLGRRSHPGPRRGARGCPCSGRNRSGDNSTHPLAVRRPVGRERFEAFTAGGRPASSTSPVPSIPIDGESAARVQAHEADAVRRPAPITAVAEVARIARPRVPSRTVAIHRSPPSRYASRRPSVATTHRAQGLPARQHTGLRAIGIGDPELALRPQRGSQERDRPLGPWHLRSRQSGGGQHRRNDHRHDQDRPTGHPFPSHEHPHPTRRSDPTRRRAPPPTLRASGCRACGRRARLDSARGP